MLLTLCLLASEHMWLLGGGAYAPNSNLSERVLGGLNQDSTMYPNQHKVQNLTYQSKTFAKWLQFKYA